MHYGEAVSLAILMADALSRLTTNGIDAVKAVGTHGPPHPLPVRVGCWVGGFNLGRLSGWLMGQTGGL